MSTYITNDEFCDHNYLVGSCPDGCTQPGMTLVTVHDGSPEGVAAEALDEVAEFIDRHCILPEHTTTAVALWCAHAHLLDHFDSTPRLAFMAPEKQCGKSRAQEVIETLVPNPLRSSNVSVSVLFRTIGSDERPTVFLDEVDTLWSGKGENEELRGLINSGHRRGADALRMVGDSTNFKPQRFRTFSAVCLAGIGDLPDTIADRAINVPMRRRLPHESVARWRFRQGEKEGHQLRRRLADAMAGLVLPDEAAIPETIGDRSSDVWEPLLAIAEAIGGQWHRDALTSCEVMTSKSPATVSAGVRLLGDIRTVWKPDATDMPTGELLHRLHSVDESPWGMEPPLTARKLAFYLKKYGVAPKHRADLRYYRRADLEDPWARYLPPQEPSSTVTTVTTGQPTLIGVCAVCQTNPPSEGQATCPSCRERTQ